jgi:hypothetical protein
MIIIWKEIQMLTTEATDIATNVVCIAAVNASVVCKVFTIKTLKIKSIPQSRHFIITKTSQLMLFKDIITVYTENHMKHINTLWAKWRVMDC